MTFDSVLIEALSLAEVLPLEPSSDAEAPVLLDVRWALGDAQGRDKYLAEHLPGAVFVDLDRELAGPASPALGRHPLPKLTALQKSARRWGVRKNSTVVVYDDWNSLAAARAWWLLTWAGIADVRILDGGLAAWRAEQLPLDGGEVTVKPGDVVLTGGHLPTVDVDAVAALAGNSDAVVLDARSSDRYRGESEPLDPKAGHIPGARNAPTTANVDAEGRFLPSSTLRQRFSELGVTDETTVATYCGSGVTATHEIAALAVAGFTAALYPGSWSQWSNTDRPVATGVH